MRKFRIIYCFLDSENRVESDEFGEVYRIAKHCIGYNGGDAIERFKKEERFIVEPEIIEVMEEAIR